ncbi:MAG: desulfoferrodoxin, partial [Nitrospirae bacterium]
MLEQKHVPLIVAPEKVKKDEWFDLKVKVGFMKEHPSTPEHWITEIKLILNGRKVAKTEYKVGGVSASEATFRIKLTSDSTLEAVEHCNLHGTWISEPVKVKVY